MNSSNHCCLFITWFCNEQFKMRLILLRSMPELPQLRLKNWCQVSTKRQTRYSVSYNNENILETLYSRKKGTISYLNIANYLILYLKIIQNIWSLTIYRSISVLKSTSIFLDYIARRVDYCANKLGYLERKWVRCREGFQLIKLSVPRQTDKSPTRAIIHRLVTLLSSRRAFTEVIKTHAV